MPGYETQKLNVNVGALQWKIRALSDISQYADPEGVAARAGICSASWSLFGQLWPASRVLAKAVKHIDIDNRRIIELGCGLGLPSLVLQSRGADVTASDHHPLSKKFLVYNAALNRLPDIPYLDLPLDIAGSDYWPVRSDSRQRYSLRAKPCQHARRSGRPPCPPESESAYYLPWSRPPQPLQPPAERKRL